jgi:hypothetical protein
VPHPFAFATKGWAFRHYLSFLIRCHPERSRSSGEVKDLPLRWPIAQAQRLGLSKARAYVCQANTSHTQLTHSPQSEFSSARNQEVPIGLAKIDVSVFSSTTSRVVSLETTGNDPIQNLLRKSLSSKILPLSYCRPRSFLKLRHENRDNHNRIMILLKTGGRGGTTAQSRPNLHSALEVLPVRK